MRNLSTAKKGYMSDSILGCFLRSCRVGDWPQLAFGLPRRIVSEQALRDERLKSVAPPVFFLSTGRCGTQTYTSILRSDRQLYVAHAPRPYMAAQSRFAFEMAGGATLRHFDGQIRRILVELFLTGRMEHLRHCHQARRRWVETNNWITFMAPSIAAVLPQARFIHLHRHPAQVVRSSMSRRWYAGNKYDAARPTPPGDDPPPRPWEDMSVLARNCWLWTQTNRFIRQFATTIDASRILTISINRADSEQADRVASFIGSRIAARRASRLLNCRTPLNAQRSPDFTAYEDWPADDRSVLLSYCGEMARQLGYGL